jgi:hypothetical protein
MIFDTPVPFREAVKQLAAKKIMPTSLTSAELGELNKAILRTSFTSAQTTIEGLLDRYKSGVASIINPDQVLRPGETVPTTEGYNPTTLRTFVKEYLRQIGYQPEEGERGSIKDLSSDGRINLVVKTNVELAQGAGHFVQGQDPDVLDAFPAQELVRFEERAKKRDWHGRWREAAVSSGDTDAARVLEQHGRMVARKDSPIWDAIGSSDLFEDALDNPFPPFAFNSGMWVVDVDFDTAEKFGLVTPDNVPKPQEIDWGELFQGNEGD